MRAAPCVLPILKIFSKKFIFVIDISFGIPYNTSCCGNKAQRIGLSPNGKATDSDSVIFKVRILVALLGITKVVPFFVVGEVPIKIKLPVSEALFAQSFI